MLRCALYLRAWLYPSRSNLCICFLPHWSCCQHRAHQHCWKRELISLCSFMCNLIPLNNPCIPDFTHGVGINHQMFFFSDAVHILWLHPQPRNFQNCTLRQQPVMNAWMMILKFGFAAFPKYITYVLHLLHTNGFQKCWPPQLQFNSCRSPASMEQKWSHCSGRSSASAHTSHFEHNHLHMEHILDCWAKAKLEPWSGTKDRILQMYQ